LALVRAEYINQDPEEVINKCIWK